MKSLVCSTVLVAVLGFAGCSGRGAQEPGNVILVIVDTLRADHLGCYGSDQHTSPNIDRLAAEGLRFADAYAQAPWTLPSIASILTGRWAHQHGARAEVDGKIHPIDPALETLAEWMQKGHYRTGAVVNVPFLAPALGLNRGFDHYDFEGGDMENQSHRTADRTTDAALAWVDTVGDAPFFLVVHYFDPHLTYNPPARYLEGLPNTADASRLATWGNPREIFGLRHGGRRPSPEDQAQLIARYDGEIRFTDAEFGRLRAGLEARGVWDQALVIVGADHGEEFWDHGGFEHGHTHYRELLHVPLIVRRPGGPVDAVHEGMVRNIDIAPTILDFASIQGPRDLPGQVLGTGGVRASLAEGSLWSGDMVSVRNSELTVIWNRTTNEQLVFDAADLQEQTNLAPQLLPEHLELYGLLRALPTSRPPGAAWEPDAEEMERLRSLGYVR